MAKIKFERTSAPIGSVEFSRNPSITSKSYQRKRQYLQPKDLADGGDMYIYDKGIAAKNYITLTFSNVPQSDYTNLNTFLGVVVGSKYNFTFTDYNGVMSTARIINSDNFQSAPVATDRESFTVELLLE